MLRMILLGLAPLCLSGCDDGGPRDARGEDVAAAGAAVGAVCEVVEAGRALPPEVRETSGLARSRARPDLLWTHNDAGGEAELYAVDGSGALVARVRVAGAESTDWEDLAAGPCDGGSCLYIADIGDNDADRDFVTVYRLPEPAAGAEEASGAVPLRARFPDAKQDAEALFVLPSGEVYLVTKGRHGTIALYRYPTGGGEVATLERVRELLPAPEDEDDRVTAATASPDGRWVAVRSYRTLYIYPAAALVGGEPVQPEVVDLSPLGEAQGESVVLSDDGTLWLSSEAANRREAPSLSRMRCALPRS